MNRVARALAHYTGNSALEMRRRRLAAEDVDIGHHFERDPVKMGYEGYELPPSEPTTFEPPQITADDVREAIERRQP